MADKCDLIDFYFPQKPELSVGDELAVECLHIATQLIKKEMEGKDRANRNLELALEWIAKANLNINPPWPPTKSGTPAAMRAH